MKNNQFLRQFSNLCGFGERTGVQGLPDKAQHFRRSAARGLKIRKIVFVLTVVLVAPVCLSPSLHAAVAPTTFTAGQETIGPGGTVYVPITVSGFSGNAGLGYSGVFGAGFSLLWNSQVLQYVGITENSTLTMNGGWLINPTVSGVLQVTWSDTTTLNGTTLNDPDTFITVQFTAIGAAGTSSDITIGDYGRSDRDIVYAPNYDEYSGANVPTVNGSVTVVPEPINWALGLFACVFIGGATVRWASSRRMSLQPAQTGSHGEPGA